MTEGALVSARWRPNLPRCPLTNASILQELQQVMEGVIQLRVPLSVKCKAGERWGSMAAVG